MATRPTTIAVAHPTAVGLPEREMSRNVHTINVPAGAIPFFACTKLKNALGYDDALDTFGVHGVGGTLGALLTGVFAQKALNGVADGLLFGNPAQLGIQSLAVLASIAYSGVATFVLLKAISVVVPLRVSENDESTGLDVSQHGEEAYMHAQGSATALERSMIVGLAPSQILVHEHSPVQ